MSGSQRAQKSAWMATADPLFEEHSLISASRTCRCIFSRNEIHLDLPPFFPAQTPPPSLQEQDVTPPTHPPTPPIYRFASFLSFFLSPSLVVFTSTFSTNKPLRLSEPHLAEHCQLDLSTLASSSIHRLSLHLSAASCTPSIPPFLSPSAHLLVVSPLAVNNELHNIKHSLACRLLARRLFLSLPLFLTRPCLDFLLVSLDRLVLRRRPKSPSRTLVVVVGRRQRRRAALPRLARPTRGGTGEGHFAKRDAREGGRGIEAEGAERC